MTNNRAVSYGKDRWGAFGGEISFEALIEDRLRFAASSAEWYRLKKRKKQFLSLSSRWMAVLLGLAGGFVPLIAPILPNLDARIGYPFLAAAAGFALVDRVFGWSKDWARYMTSATEIEAKAELFRIRSAGIMRSPNPEDKVIISELERFTAEVSSIIVVETSKWDADHLLAMAEIDNLSKAKI